MPRKPWTTWNGRAQLLGIVLVVAQAIYVGVDADRSNPWWQLFTAAGLLLLITYVVIAWYIVPTRRKQ